MAFALVFSPRSDFLAPSPGGFFYRSIPAASRTLYP